MSRRSGWVLGEACTPRQELHGVQEHAQIKGRV